MRPPALALVLALATGLAGCVSVRVSVCGPGADRREVAQLYFGRNIGERVGVSEAEFQAFLDAEVTPRFPDGLTVTDASGQWRGAGGAVREPSKVVTIVLKGAADDRARLAAVAQAYKRRFSQESVMTTVEAACVGF